MPRGIILLFSVVICMEYSSAESPATIVSSKSVNNGDSYNFRYETSDGQIRTESGKFVPKGDQLIWTVQGYYTYVVDGTSYKVIYSADDDGYEANTKSEPALGKPPPGFFVKRINSATLASLSGGGLG